MGMFGSDYPPGCHSTPYDEDPPADNSVLKEAFADYASPFELYRATYKAVACGPTVTFTVRHWVTETIGEGPCAGEPWEYEKDIDYTTEELKKLGTWADMDAAGALVTQIQVSSIIEGSDAEVPPTVIDLAPAWDCDLDADGLQAAWAAALAEVEAQADELWSDSELAEVNKLRMLLRRVTACPALMGWAGPIASPLYDEIGALLDDPKPAPPRHDDDNWPWLK